SHDNVFFRADVTNRPLPELGGSVTPEGVIHVERARFLWNGRLYERIMLKHYSRRSVPAPLKILYAADFADIFEVRGYTRRARGLLQAPVIDSDVVTLAYDGLDGELRKSVLAFSRAPDRLSDDAAEFKLMLGEPDPFCLYLEVGTDRAPTPSRE